MLNEKELASLIPAASVEIFEEIDSTNLEAKRRVQSLGENESPSPTLILAHSQTAGRGRMGRSFLSRAGSGIFMTLLYFTDKSLSDAVSITTAAAAIVAEEIEKVTASPMRIKWVNDVYNESGKVSGILVESVMRQNGSCAIIVGIGINTGEFDFPEELRGIASSIGDVSGRESLLVSAIANRLLSHSESPLDRGYMVEYRKRFMLLGERVDLISCGSTVDAGIVVGVDDEGGLIFVPDGTSERKVIRTGEISVRKAK